MDSLSFFCQNWFCLITQKTNISGAFGQRRVWSEMGVSKRLALPKLALSYHRYIRELNPYECTLSYEKRIYKSLNLQIVCWHKPHSKMIIIGGLLCLISTLPLLCQSLQVVVREEKIVTKIGDNVQLICSAVSERVGCSFTSPIGKFFSLWSIFVYSRWLTISNSLANFESRLARHRFSQKTNGRICIVYFFTLHGKQIKFVRSFFWRICFLKLTDL